MKFNSGSSGYDKTYRRSNEKQEACSCCDVCRRRQNSRWFDVKKITDDIEENAASIHQQAGFTVAIISKIIKIKARLLEVEMEEQLRRKQVQQLYSLVMVTMIAIAFLFVVIVIAS